MSEQKNYQNPTDGQELTNWQKIDQMEADIARKLPKKKRSGGMVNLIIPERIGYCRIAPTPVENIQSFIEAGL